MLKKQGVSCINYLDDLLIVSDSKTKNWIDLDKTINLLVSLGFIINWDKVEPPTQSLSFLGVAIDSVSRTLALPQAKILEVKILLQNWLSKKTMYET